MPLLVLTNPGVRDSVTRPVVLDIVRQLLTWTGLPQDTRVLYPGDNETALQPGSKISTDKEFNTFGTDSQWFITVEENYQEDRALSMAVTYDDNPKIFDDEDARVWIKPAYSPCDVVLRVRSRFTDKDAATRWRDDIRSRVAMLRDARVHNVSYSYLIPLEFMVVLKEIHRMRESVAPYNQTWEEYIDFYRSTKVRQLSDLVGKNQEWGVAETQARVLGYFDFGMAPEQSSKNSEDSTHAIEFTYSFKYDKPVSSVMSYPLVINNQLMDKRFRQTTAVERVEDYQLQYSHSADAFAHFENARLTQNIAMPGISIPEFDEFIPARGTVPPDTIRVLTGLTTIDEANPLDLLQLDQLGNQSILPEVLEFMRGEVNWMTKLGQSIFHLMVYRNQHPLPKEGYVVGSDLMVRLINPPNLRDIYHVRLALYQRPRLLPNAAKDRLRNNCAVARILLSALKTDLTAAGFLQTCQLGNYMTRQDFDRAADEIDRYFDSKFNRQIYQFNTVSTLFVQSHKLTDSRP